ncbi:hypothetical protein LguiA_035950 [Lonicera macranthoides]
MSYFNRCPQGSHQTLIYGKSGPGQRERQQYYMRGLVLGKIVYGAIALMGSGEGCLREISLIWSVETLIKLWACIVIDLQAMGRPLMPTKYTFHELVLSQVMSFIGAFGVPDKRFGVKLALFIIFNLFPPPWLLELELGFRYSASATSLTRGSCFSECIISSLMLEIYVYKAYKADDLADLEWLSYFVDESFSAYSQSYSRSNDLVGCTITMVAGAFAEVEVVSEA